jgi:serine/threonine protein kinase
MQPQLGSLAPLAAGDPPRIGGYELVARLGVGGMGTVYLGRDGNDFVAVKVIRPELALDSSFRGRFRDEAAAARRVAAFCTAQVLDADPDADPPFIVTEYIDGVPLDHVVRTKGPLPPSTLHGVGVGVATALAAIHAAGLVHRDLKPSNVLLSLSGPRVIDFGIARSLIAPSGHTMAGVVLGTPGWMAPEQLRGGPVGPAADVFAWGCLVVYAATGHNPWGDGAPTTIAHAVLHEPPDLAGVPNSLRPFVEEALRPAPERRPAARDLVLRQLGGARSADPDAAVTSLLQRTWAPPPTLADPDAADPDAADPDAVATEQLEAVAPTERLAPPNAAGAHPDQRNQREWWAPPQEGWTPPEAPAKADTPPQPPGAPAVAAPAQSFPPVQWPLPQPAPPAQHAPQQQRPQPPAQPYPPPYWPYQPPSQQPSQQQSHQQPRQPAQQFPPRFPPPPYQGNQPWYAPPGNVAQPAQPGSSARPVGRVPPYVPPIPPRRRHRVRWLLLSLCGLFLLFFLVFLSRPEEVVRGLASPPAAAASAGDTVRDGVFEFVVRDIDCRSRPGGRVCVVALQVKNLAAKDRRLPGRSQVLHDTLGDYYRLDRRASQQRGSDLFESIRTGDTVIGEIVFKLPATRKAGFVELHDSVLSKGVSVQF